MNNIDFDQLNQVIEQAYDAGIYGFGIRAMKGGVVVKVGDELENSYHWEDGEFTDEQIDGTCAIGVDVDFGELEDTEYFLEQLAEVKKTYGGNGEQIVLIAGHQNLDEAHMDNGEIILSDATCIAVL